LYAHVGIKKLATNDERISKHVSSMGLQCHHTIIEPTTSWKRIIKLVSSLYARYYILKFTEWKVTTFHEKNIFSTQVGIQKLATIDQRNSKLVSSMSLQFHHTIIEPTLSWKRIILHTKIFQIQILNLQALSKFILKRF
jgi:hypothetical protein